MFCKMEILEEVVNEFGSDDDVLELIRQVGCV